MDQSSLDQFGTDARDDDTDERNRGYTRYQIAVREAPDGAEPFADDSCPWCLGSADDFVTKTNDDVTGTLPRDPQVSCGHCSAVIPTDMDWYQRGEKKAFTRHNV
jgi:hypothetical protein